MAAFDKMWKKLKSIRIYQDNGGLLKFSSELKKSFENQLDRLHPSQKILDIISEVFQENRDSQNSRYHVYKKVQNRDNDWRNTKNNTDWIFKESNSTVSDKEARFIIKQFNKKGKSSEDFQNTAVILSNMSYEDDFMIEVPDRKPEDLNYIKSELENFAKNYELKQEIFKLKEENINKDKKYQDAEKKLVTANKEIRRKVYELHNLVEASNDIYSILDFKQLINSSLLTVIGQVGFQKAFILLYDNISKKFNQIHHKGFVDSNFKKINFELTSPIVSYFFKNRTPFYINRLEQNKNLSGFAKELKKLGILVIAPLIYSERLQGIIGAGEKLHYQDFTDADFEIFHILVNIISISIGNSHMFQEIKTLSLTDGMTGLHNYRYFEDRLKEELNRAKRHKKSISLMILDIDHFKNYNDTLGHQAGDEILRTLGKILKNTIRDEDIVARYGGEEFCIILPGIEKQGIPILGERVRKKVESEKFFKEEVQPGGKLTISIGTATFPEDASNFSKLVEKADKALYQAKNEGRNQLRIYDKKTTGA